MDAELKAAIDDLSRAAAAAKDARPNAMLDEVFAAPPTAPARPDAEPARPLRENPDLDAAFGEPAPPPAVPAPAPLPRPAARPVPWADPTRAEPVALPVAQRPVLGPAFDPAAPLPPRNPLAPTPPDGGRATAPPAPVVNPIFAADAPLPPRNPLAPDGGRATVSGPVGSPPAPPAQPGTGPNDVPRLVREIRDILARSVQRAASPTGQAPGPADPTRGPVPEQYGLRDAVKPVTDWAGNTQVGRIAQRAWSRLPPSVRKGVARQAGKALRSTKAGRWVSGKWTGATPKLPAGGGAMPPIPPAGAAAGAGAAGSAGTAGAAGGGATAAAGAGGLGAAAGAAAAVPVAGAAIAAAAALFELTKVGKDLARAQESRIRELGEFSAPQAAQGAQLDIARARRTQESGAATADSSQRLTDSLDRFEEATQPIGDLADTIGNLVGSGVLDTLTNIAEVLEPLVVVLQAIASRMVKGYKPDERDPTFAEQLDRAYQDDQRRLAGIQRAADVARQAADRFRGPGR